MVRHTRRAGWFERLDVRLALGVASLVLVGCGSGEQPTTTTGQGGGGGQGGQGGQGGNACPPGKGACDADPLNDCETDLDTDALNCGSCNMACALPNSASACQDGQCVVSACNAPFEDCNKITADGCESNLMSGVKTCGSCNVECTKANTAATCNSGICENKACAAGFDDCNALPDDGCEQDITASLEHCGGCNVGCDLANAAESCGGGSCLLGACDPGFANCDNNPATGCESELASDAQHCGSCSNDCSTVYPHAEATCGGGVCSPGACLAGYVDLDGSLGNGCEYACTYVGAVDVPDDGFVDENCDGIDGTVSQAIFVATTGNDSNPGTMAAPTLTVNGGIAKALSAGKAKVYISQGLYDGRVTLANGVSLHGGYSQANGWTRSATFIATIQSGAVSSGRVSAVEGSSITAATTVDRLTIKTLGTAAIGVSSYAMACNGCTALTLKNSTLEAGDAGPGVAGVNGTNGLVGGGASSSGAGSCTSNVSGGAGGIAGTSPCGRNGGAGGKGGDINAADGSSGGTGVGGTLGGLGGLGGSVGVAGAKGTNGMAGSAGNNGLGAGGGVVTMGFWLGTAGLNGLDGANGNGGSGGGGGGASTVGAGNGGGGGAGGGCGGTAATGGTAGGGSFGLFLVSSTGFVMSNNSITSSSGGKGGNGGNGGLGGGGGGGTAGAQVCTSEVGAGGIGGHGGNGGRGGHGGGASGGASFAVFRSVTTVDVAGNMLNGGNGGNGGSSTGNSGSPGGSGTLF